MGSAIEDQERWDETGEAPDWRSADPNVPPDYSLDLEFNCYTNTENLVEANPQLRYAEGKARLTSGPDRSWGDHAWAVTKDGKIVDPYFEWRFPGVKIEYRERKCLSSNA